MISTYFFALFNEVESLRVAFIASSTEPRNLSAPYLYILCPKGHPMPLVPGTRDSQVNNRSATLEPEIRPVEKDQGKDHEKS